jgi:ethanolamine utilization protein EutN
MIIAKVTGSVVSTRKNELLTGYKLLVVEPLDENLQPQKERRFVAVDNLGAGQGELVLVATGSAARLTDRKAEERPIDAAVVGIIDSPEKISIL